MEPWQVLELLSALVDKSLVTYEETEDGTSRYRLLETVRQYGAERLREAGEAQPRARGTAMRFSRSPKTPNWA